MRLTTLELSGFKSFARNTVLGFSHPVTAIVGPNGSGKSNIAESIRWALGEQSMKSLRGKKGEDLIFNGTAQTPRTGKASVRLIFDNRDAKIPLDFPEVIFERKIFRDGLNEYYLNNSQVRLKDVVELLARMGLGESKHNIIGQGEVDRILLAGPRERREMLEEAIGLRVYQLKKNEAERRLEETSRNIIQAQAILKEIAPHLKFLKVQAEKAENREVITQELRAYECAWASHALADIASETKKLSGEQGDDRERLRVVEAEVKKQTETLRSLEQKLEKWKPSREHAAKPLDELDRERQNLVRELGRIEGRLESSPRREEAPERLIEAAYVRKHLSGILDHLEEIQIIDDIDEVREKIETLTGGIERLLAEIETHRRPAETAGAESNSLQKELKNAQETLKKQISLLEERIRNATTDNEQKTTDFIRLQEEVRIAERTLREREEKRNQLSSTLQRWLFDRERLQEREQEIQEEMKRMDIRQKDIETIDTALSAYTADDLKRKIEKFRIKLEEIGGIDPATTKEYHDTKTRHDFLAGELADLETASRDLRFLVKELEETMEHDFENGFDKIKEEFNNYFRIIFGGGKGVLKYTPLHTAKEGGEETAENQETEYGIEIDVDIPRKRVQSLTMLSGGEKALTSIALLFAITIVNPPPFLVLDETDAALDEANSQKYGAILRELSKKTQLLIITHNRETMKQAGVLYGVTMGSEGVSKLLSLKFEEAEAYTNR